jgi:hypothetical protein
MRRGSAARVARRGSASGGAALDAHRHDAAGTHTGGEEVTRQIDAPQPGFWMIRLVKGGPEVPARIFRHVTTHEPGAPGNAMERPSFLVAEIAGEPVDLDDVWLRSGREITQAEYQFQVADHAHAREWRPRDAKANPRHAIDLMATALPF